MAVSTLRPLLTQHLRYLLSNSNKDKPLSYHDCLKDASDIAETLARLGLPQLEGTTAKACLSNQGERIYCVQMVKKIILTQFELLCVSYELQNDIENAFSECKKICEVSDDFTKYCSFYYSSNRSLSTVKLEFPDFAERLVNSRSKLISSEILKHPSRDTLLQLAKFEFGFIRAMLGMFATYTDLLKTQSIKHTKMVYVSEDMFSMVQGHSNTTWLDCLIPGAQSESLRLAGKELSGRLWGKVAENVVQCLQPVVVDGWAVVKLLPLVEQIQKEEDLQHYSAMVKSLWHISTSIRQQACLVHWDAGFQQLLVAMSVDSRKGFKSHFTDQSTTKSASLMTSSVLAPLSEFVRATPSKLLSQTGPTNTPALLACHLDDLRISQPVAMALEASVRQFSMFLLQGMRSCLVNWNLRGLGQGLLVDVPAVIKHVAEIVDSLSRVAAPLFAFPPHMSACIIESSSRQSFSLLYNSYRALKDFIEDLCVSFNTSWSCKCAQVLKSFPSQKGWKSAGKKMGAQKPDVSDYCEVVIESLLAPIFEACLSLPLNVQAGLVVLGLCVVFLELRRVILSNQQTYTPSAGRQLLTDYRHLHHWLTSSCQSLSSEAAHVVSSLPLLAEVEHGLLMVCGTAGPLEEQPQGGAESLSTMIPIPHLPIFREMAWISSDNWTRTIAC